jgi:hypothetical protein
VTHFVEEELRRTFAAHDPGSADSGGEILATVARQAGRARRRRIAVAGGALAVIAVTGVALPVLWPRGGTSSLPAGDGGPYSHGDGGPYGHFASQSADAVARWPYGALTLPADLHVPLAATVTPAGYGPFAPAVGDGYLGLLAEAPQGRGEIAVKVFGARPKFAPPAGGVHTRPEVNGRVADAYHNRNEADVLWQRQTHQWVLVEVVSKSVRPSAGAEALDVARGLVDQAAGVQYRVLFSQAPGGYAYTQVTQFASTVAPAGDASDADRAISARLLPAAKGGLPAGQKFTWNSTFRGVLRDNRVADVDLRDGTWLEVRFGPDANVTAMLPPGMVKDVIVLPGPAPTS